MSTNPPVGPPVGPLEAAAVAWLTPPPRLKKDGKPVKARESRPRVEDDKYCEMTLRVLNGLELRGIDNPAILPLVLRVEERAKEMANVIIATNAERYMADPTWAPALREMGRWIGIAESSVHQRKTVGAKILAKRDAEAGVTRLTPAARAKTLIKAVAELVGVTSLDAYRAQHRKAS